MVMSLQVCASLSNEDGGHKPRHNDKANVLLVVSTSSGFSWGLTLRAEIRVATGYDDPLADAILGRTIAAAADGEQAFLVIDSWVNSCINEHHTHCKESPQPPRLPTRVVDVSSPELDVWTVCIRDDQNKEDHTGRYVALSHCWGKCLPFATTTENLEDRKREIRISDMSQVFQEAILITRRLGIRYLWIDTLCIVQNDRHDWQVEAGRMAAVYMDAFLVIGASKSSADDQGFLCPREHRASLSFVESPHAGPVSSLNLSLLPPVGERWTSGQDPVSPEPLQSRAWCLQERYLSQRILLYGARQLFWECRTLSQAEDGDVRLGNIHNLDRLRRTAAIERSVFGPRPNGDSEVNYRGWYEMIEEYTQRSISIQSDRLPALSGVANAMAQKSKDVYYAGLWKKGLIEGLLWSGTNRKEPLMKPTAYRAPSWSWVSVEGPVKFIVYHFIDRCRWKRAIADYEPLATFIDCDVEPDSPDLYGAVRGGYLRLNAPLLSIEAICPTDHSSPFSEMLLPPLRNPVVDKLVKVDVGHDQFYLQAGFDLDSEPLLLQEQLFVLLLARLPDGNTGFSPFIDHRFGLLVKRTEKDNEVYERVGIIDSPILQKATYGGFWMIILCVLESLLRFLQRLSKSENRSSISNMTPRLFVPEKALTEEPEEEMPADPMPELEQYSVSITLV
ncbi:hypothetical protein ETB97_009791 [Aspergillus alliaceus]|uniref:Heterokaryon incompatibility domain-containing protein n=1 Tax=Petromyces alliaceus TaxID=209559 RepID=A0A8H6AAB4_PETAA|nr:hypothetical protein ETB97_009791 [Aspergillus burnettii]